MSEIWTGQVGIEAADAYEAEFASVFAQWSPLVLDAAAVQADTMCWTSPVGPGFWPGPLETA